MTDLNLLVEERRGAIDVLTTWLPRIAIAILFFVIGTEKFAAHSVWVRIFTTIGLGQWFRYVTGGIQIAGALCLLVPALAPIGFVLLGCTMAGAMAFWIFIAHLPFTAIIPGLLLTAIAVIGWIPVTAALRNLGGRPVSN